MRCRNYFLLLFSHLVMSGSWRIPWAAACQASLSFTVSWNLLKLMSIESVMPFNHLILCCPLLFLPSIFPSIGVFSSQSALCLSNSLVPHLVRFSDTEFLLCEVYLDKLRINQFLPSMKTIWCLNLF